MKKHVVVDIVIVGGGIAGLWLLNRLRKSGFSAILFESGTLGGSQTHKAQGILHGGMKYALQGVLTQSAEAMADMPKRWNACLAGHGEIDLSRVPIHSKAHYLWAPRKFTAKLTGLLASALCSSKVEALQKEHYPTVFKHPAFKGMVYALDETVIDVPILVSELVKANKEAIFSIASMTPENLTLDSQGQLVSATVNMAGKTLEVRAQQFIFTAGAGNDIVIKKLKRQDVAMQRRPLHMVLVKMPCDYPLYAHCLGLGSRPRLTITTHYAADGSTIWYLGGLLAEVGVKRNSAEQIQAARDELHALFPWVDFKAAEFATFMIDRAEPKQEGGLKPDRAYVKVIENMMIAWPTKLALAPMLADDIMLHLQRAAVSPQLFDVSALQAWPMPVLAKPIWEDAFCRNVE